MANTIWINCGDGNAVEVPEGADMINSEGVGVWEPEGFSFFALRPRKCRNGKTRNFTWLQRHKDGTYTK